MVKKLTPYSKLSSSSQKRFTSILKKVHMSGSTIPKAKKMSVSEFKTLLGSTAKDSTIKAYQRVLKQATATKERREGTVKEALKVYKKIGFKGVGLKKIEKELTQTAGNTFSALSDELQDKLNMDEKESYKTARELLALPESEYGYLDQEEEAIIQDFDTP